MEEQCYALLIDADNVSAKYIKPILTELSKYGVITYKSDTKKTGIFAAGVLFGTAGIRLLSGGDAKKVYTYCTAAALRAKECIMDTVSRIQENAEDIYAEAVQMNEERAAGETEFEDEGSLKEERGNGKEEEI